MSDSTRSKTDPDKKSNDPKGGSGTDSSDDIHDKAFIADSSNSDDEPVTKKTKTETKNDTKAELDAKESPPLTPPRSLQTPDTEDPGSTGSTPPLIIQPDQPRMDYSSSDSDDLAVTPEGGTYKITGFINQPKLRTGESNKFCCPIDSFLLSLKLAMLRTRYLFESNFKCDPEHFPRGYQLEQSLRELLFLFTMRDRVTGRRFPNFELPFESFYVQSAWIDYLGGVDNRILKGSEGSRVFDHTSDVSSFRYSIRCPNPFEGERIIHTQVCATAWFRSQLDLNAIASHRKLPFSSQRVLSARCPRHDLGCCTPTDYLTTIQIFPRTWMFVLQNLNGEKESSPDIIDTMPEQIRLQQLNPDDVITEEVFRKSYVSYTLFTRGRDLSHLISIQRVKNELFLYNDLDPEASLYVTQSTVPEVTNTNQYVKLSAIIFYRLPSDKRAKRPNTPRKDSMFRNPGDSPKEKPKFNL